jgi:hypothetical protein
MAIDNRRYPRVEIAWPVTLMTPYGPVGGTTQNLSLGGACIRLAEAPELEEVFRLVIRPAEQQILPATAELVWSGTFREDTSMLQGMGVRFKYVADDNVKFMNKAISGIILQRNSE